MTMLAMDTATDTLSIAVGAGADILSCTAARIPRGHSHLLQPVVLQVLQTAGVRQADLRGICVGTGPGSYTGVRIAVSTAKAMAFALHLPLFTASTLLAIAEAALPGHTEAAADGGEDVALPLIYARRRRAYGALYRKDASGRWTTVIAPQVKSLEDWIGVWDSREARGLSRTVIHDLAAHPNSADDLARVCEPGGLAKPDTRLVDLALIGADIAAALIRLVDSGQAARAEGKAVHQVAPDYTQLVEAEVKLGKRSDDA